MKKYMVIIGFLILFATVAYAQEIGYSDKIEEAIFSCNNCNVCPDGKTISQGKICLYFFWGQGCPHCAEEKPFLEELKKKYPNLEIYDFEVYYHPENVEFWKQVCERYNTRPSGVPMTFVGNKAFIGFLNRGFYTNSTVPPTSDSVILFPTVLAITLACVFSIVLIVFLVGKRVKIRVKK